MLNTPNDRLPRLPYRRIWTMSLLLALLLFIAWEGFWRARGFRPSLLESPDAWAMTRARADDNPQAIILVGASRMHLDIDTQTIQRKTGIAPVQLAIDGTSPVAILDDLSRDPKVKGTLWCEMNESYVPLPPGLSRPRPQSADNADPSNEAGDAQTAELYLKSFRERTLSQSFEAWMRTRIEDMLVSRLPALSPIAVFNGLLRRKMPTPNLVQIAPDRSAKIDYHTPRLPQIRAERLKRLQNVLQTTPAPTSPQFLEGARQLEPIIARLKSRGVRVVFIRFPTSGEYARLENGRYPRAQFWNPFAAQMQQLGVVTLHFADDAALRGFHCPDGSHLDGHDAPAFTRALLEVESGLPVFDPHT